MLYPNGSRYEGYFREGIPYGYGKGTHPDGCICEGDVVFTYKRGLLTFTWPDGESYQGMHENGNLHGLGIHKWPDGQIYYGEFKENCEEGFGVMI